jgi:hypothetical protein
MSTPIKNVAIAGVSSQRFSFVSLISFASTNQLGPGWWQPWWPNSESVFGERA